MTQHFPAILIECRRPAAISVLIDRSLMPTIPSGSSMRATSLRLYTRMLAVVSATMSPYSAIGNVAGATATRPRAIKALHIAGASSCKYLVSTPDSIKLASLM